MSEEAANITQDQLNNFIDENEAAKEALSQTVSEQMQTIVNLRSQNALLRRQIARLSSPKEQAPNESGNTEGSETSSTVNPEPTDSSQGDSKATQPDAGTTDGKDESTRSKKGKKVVK